MKFIVIAIFLVIFSPYFSDANWCIKNTIKHIQTTRHLATIKTYRAWLGRKKQKQEIYTITESVPHTIQHRVCCEGYTLDNIHKICKPNCPQGCPKSADCSKPNTCECHHGFQMIAERCQPICDPTCDINASCSAPNLCLCNYGFYKKSFDDVCEPWCKTECVNGQCIGIDNCSCDQGFVKDNGACVLDCKRNCRFGRCSKNVICECLKGFEYNETTGSCEISLNEESTTIDDIPTEEHTAVSEVQSESTLRTLKIPIDDAEITPAEEEYTATVPEVHSESTSRTLRISTAETETTTASLIEPTNVLTECEQRKDCWLGRCSKKGICECWLGYGYIESNWECEHSFMTDGMTEEEYTAGGPEVHSDASEEIFSSSTGENPAQTETTIPSLLESTSMISYQENDSNEGLYSAESSKNREQTSSSEPSVVSIHKSTEQFDNCDHSCWGGICINKVCQCPVGLTFNREINDCSIVCDIICNNGVCEEGYIHENSTECVPNCDHKCINSICVAPRKCECLEGFAQHSKKWFECVPIRILVLSKRQKRNYSAYSWIWGILPVVILATLGLFAFRKLRKGTYNVDKFEKNRHKMQVHFKNKNEQFV